MTLDGSRSTATSVAAVMAAVAVVAVVLSLSMVPVAKAEFSIADFTVSSTTSVAGAYPDLTTNLRFSTKSNPPFTPPDGNVRDLSVNLPAGFAGDPTALPQCLQVDFSAFSCPPSTQIGIANLSLASPPSGYPLTLKVPVFNLEPRKEDVTAEIAFSLGAGLIVVHMPISVRTDGDYGLTTTVNGVNRAYSLVGVSLKLWGVPADSSHDGERIDQLNDQPVPPPQIARRPFFMNPTQCNNPLTFTARANSFQNPAKFSEASAVLPSLVDCEKVPFKPGFSFQAASRVAGAPSGFQSVLTVPYSTDPDGRGSASLRKAVVTLPAGVALSPSAGAGLGSCDDVHLNLRSTGPAACPDDAKIGTAEFDVPALAKPLEGAIYQRQPLPGNLFRIVLVADGFGVHLKIPADVKADPVTGQLTATFVDTPQVPFRQLTLNFDGGQHAPLSNPPACGTYTTRAQLTPWSSSTPVTVDSSFTIDQGCGKENVFAPGFSAGGENPTAGAYTPFHLRITRDSGPALSSVDTVMPLGLLANIKSVPRCAETRAAAGTCGPESQVGHVTVGAGAGNDPLFLPEPGKAPTAVYLAGPYKGAPFSLSIVVPAQAGPFDLGTVVVRAGLYVDPETAQATVKADPMPTILEGIPLNVRDLRVDIDRPGFTFNPTNCDPQAVTGTITSAAGQAVAVSSPFRVVDCDQLELSPNLDLTFSGKGQTTDGKHPTVSATLSQPFGQSNLEKVEVTLPLSLALDPDNSQSNDLCEFADGRKTIPECPKSSIVGTATAKTPILDQPLTGPVYFIKNVRTDPKSGRQIRTLPTLATVLRGEGITLVLRATSAVDDNDQLVTTFANIPDAPVSNFRLNINGGKKGILVISDADICKSTQILDQVTDGQNGETRDDKVTIATPSCPLAVVGSSHTSSALQLKVGGLGAGTVTASGKGLKKTRRTLAESTVATLSLSLSKSMRATLAHGHNVKVKVSLAFTPKGSKKATKATKALVIHGAKR